ncbi:Ankyrin repeat family protein [Quillaja saponaria]|uniref:Ankyrin repeat family protein n=1 Tax=Quillaja saponaria TaxID=32244 RepID=A0AAD7PF72_QUISA|nr:Ankyrin repeat family protein [Quillaja saponaria]
MVKSAGISYWESFYRDELYYVLQDDDKDTFLHRMNNKINSLSYKPEAFPTEIMSKIIGNRATDIFTAVYNGETGLKPTDVNDVDPTTHVTLLHRAAAAYAFDLIDSLLNHGARTDVRCNCKISFMYRMLPLNVALHCICTIDEFVNKWTPKQSLFNLIIRLCNPFKTGNKLKVSRLLVWNTEGTEYEIYRYAKEGKVMEIAALLLAAPEKMVKSNGISYWESFYLEELFYVLQDDDEDTFLERMNNKINSLSYKPEVFPTEIMSEIIRYGATDIFTAVYNGKTGLKPTDVNAVDPTTHVPLLHTAAASYAFDLIDSLLNRGARTDVRCNCKISFMYGMLPLNVALHCIWCVAFVIDIQTLQGNKLQVSRLLVWNTEGTEYEIYRYAKEGKVMEIAALLLAAPEKVLSPSIFEKITNFSCPHGSMTLRQYITSEIASLTALRMRFVLEARSYAPLQACNDKLAAMKSMLLLLEVFERTGDKITRYIQQISNRDDVKEVVKKLSWLIQDSGFALDYADLHIDYLISWKGMELRERLQRAVNCEIEKEKFLGLRLPDCMESSDLQLCGKKLKGKGMLWNVTIKSDAKLLTVKVY